MFQVTSRTCSVNQFNTPLSIVNDFSPAFSKQSNYSMFWDGYPGHAFHTLKGPLKHLVWTSINIVIAIDMSTELNQTSSRKSVSSSILFLNHWHITKRFFLCQLAWVYARSGFCIGTAEDPSLKFFAKMHVKDKVLRNIFRGAFSDFFKQNLSPYPPCQDILQSTSCLIWDFLPFCWSCLLTLWLKICVPNDKFGFSGDNC